MITVDNMRPVLSRNPEAHLRLLLTEGDEIRHPSMSFDLGDGVSVLACISGIGKWDLFAFRKGTLVDDVDTEPVQAFIDGIDLSDLQIKIETSQLVRVVDVEHGVFGQNRIYAEVREWLLKDQWPTDCRDFKVWLDAGRAPWAKDAA